jgi:4-amino-4-deoxychorismate lyase
MSLFIETMRMEDGRIPLLPYHQQRIDRTLAHLGKNVPFLLKDLLVVPEEAQKGVFKCRITYSPEKVSDIQFHSYMIKAVKTISLVDIGDHTYPFKYENRAWIMEFLERSSTDEIIMCKEDLITDASYANLAFFNGRFWVTPKKPLLFGTRRQQLLQNNILREEDIFIKDLQGYSRFKFINAMMTWEETPILQIGQILLP